MLPHFISGCFFTTSEGLSSFEHPLNKLKPVPGVDSIRKNPCPTSDR